MAEISEEDAERLRHIALQFLALTEKWGTIKPTTKEIREWYKAHRKESHVQERSGRS